MATNEVDLSSNLNAPSVIKKPGSLPPLPPEVLAALNASVGAAGGAANPVGASAFQGEEGGDTATPDVVKKVLSTPPPTEEPDNSLPPAINGMVGAIPKVSTPPPPETDQDREDNITASMLPSQNPTLAPRKKSFLEKALPFIQLAGAVGGGLETAGNPSRQPYGAEMMERSLQAQKQRELEQERIQAVEAPRAEAMRNFYSGKNQTAIDVQNLKNVGGANIQDIRNAGNLSVEQLKTMVALSKVTRVEDGQDPETGQPIKLAYNGQGQLVGKLQGSLASPSFYPKQTNTTQFMPNASGNIEALPKTTNVGPRLPQISPGASAPPSPATTAPSGVPGVNPPAPAGVPTPLAPQVPSQGALPQQGGGARRPLPNQGQGGAKPIQGRPVLDSEGNPMHKPLGAEQQKNVQQIDTVTGMMNNILPDLQSVVNDMHSGGNLQDSAKTRAAWAIYSKLGLDPSNVDPNSLVSTFRNQFGMELDPRLARIFPTIAMVQVLGVQPYLHGIRNMDYVHQIQQHLPNPEKDSPDFMLSKLQQLAPNLQIARNSIYSSAGINPTQSSAQPRGGAAKTKVDLTKFERGK